MIDMASKHIVVWPRVRVFVKGDSKIVDRGEFVPDGVSTVDLENLVSFGAIAGVTEGPQASGPADDDAPAKSDRVEDILAEVGEDPEKAAAALAAEREARGDKARKTLVESLEATIAKATA